jgi:hypothetical protein
MKEYTVTVEISDVYAETAGEAEREIEKLIKGAGYGFLAVRVECGNRDEALGECDGNCDECGADYEDGAHD